MPAPFFSIIIPTYNSEALIDKSVNSIIGQTFKDYEVLIMDGLSKDDTLNIVRDKKDERFKIYSEQDSGIYDAMNKGLKASRGRWIYFLGSDDTLYDDDVLKKIHGILMADPCDVLYGNVMSDRYPGIVYDGKFSFEKIYDKNICHQAIFIKREVFEITGHFNVEFKYNADWDHNMKWMFNPSFKKRFADLVISNYGAAGVSSYTADHLFIAMKTASYLRYGKKYLSTGTKMKLYGMMARNHKNKNDYLSFFFTRLRLFLLKSEGWLKKQFS